MTLTNPSRARGLKNWYSNTTNGLKATLDAIIAQVNSLVLSGITADTFYTAASYTGASNQTPSTLPNVNTYNFTTTGRTVTLPSAVGEDTIFDGGWYWFFNSGDYSYSVLDNTGTELMVVGAGSSSILVCTNDTTAAGSWNIVTTSPSSAQSIIANQMFS